MSDELDDSSAGAGRSFSVAGWQVTPGTGMAVQGERQIKLEPRVMELLVFFVDHAGEVVSRETIERDVWQGRVVSYDALTSSVQKLRRALGDDSRKPRIIETISKRGYRLIAPVGYVSEPLNDRRHQSATLSRSYWVLTVVAALIVLIAVVAPVLWSQLEQPPSAGPHSRSIAILPFSDLSTDQQQSYFSEGMADDLITRLSKNPALFVISSDSSGLYKHSEDWAVIADRLRVRYLLSGSVRRENTRLRINVQLIEAASGVRIWAENYDGKAGDVFELQDRIVDSVADALESRMRSQRRDQPANLAAYEAFLQGRNRFFKYASKEENRKAREFYFKALELDENFALAYAMLGWTYAFEAMNGWSQDREASLGRALKLAEKARGIDDSIPVVYFVTGLVHRERGEYERALGDAKKAIELEPSYANAHILLATLHYYTGDPELGLQLVRKAMKLNPHYPYNYPFHLGQALYILGRYPEAIEAFNNGLETNPGSERMHLWLAAAYAQSGNLDNAAWEVQQVLVLDPEFSLERIRKSFPFKREQDMEHFLEGLRKAGFEG